MSVSLPGPEHRLVVVGRTGSGKSVAAAHHLWLHTENHNLPWLVFNPKNDKLLDSIGAERLDITKPLHKKLPPRIYIVNPTPESNDDIHVDNLIRQIIDRGRMGIYMDEGYSIPKHSKPFRRALTQGRSKHVPMITLSQRPVDLDKFVFTEASMYRVFHLVDELDKKKVKANTGIDLSRGMEEYTSHWYDVGRDTTHLFGPGPDDNYVRELFSDRKQSSGPRWI